MGVDSRRDTKRSRCSESKIKTVSVDRGGCALVWLAKKAGTEEKTAVKQFAKGNGFKCKADVESCRVEVAIGNLLFHAKETDAAENEKYPGLKNIAAYVNYINDTKDVWVIYEVGGSSLTKLLFDVKGMCFSHIS